MLVRYWLNGPMLQLRITENKHGLALEMELIWEGVKSTDINKVRNSEMRRRMNAFDRIERRGLK